MENKTKIILTRRSAWMNRLRSYDVWIDGVLAGKVKNGSSEEFPVTPGTHNIQCRIAWYSSPVFSVTVEQGNIEYLVVKSGMKYYSVMIILMFLGIVINISYSKPRDERPLWVFLVQLVLILPSLLYILYYVTAGRKNYLVIEEDKENVFAS